MRKTGVLSLCTLALALSGAALAQTTLSTVNDPNVGPVEVTSGIILATGPRTGANGVRFFNVQGDAAGTNASYGLLRFDLTRVRNQFNTIYGANKWRVTGLSLALTQENAAFSVDGRIFFDFTPDDTTNINSTTLSPFRYPTPAPADQQRITAFDFVSAGIGIYQVDNVNLFSSTPGGTTAACDIQNDNLLTLVVNPDNTDPADVAATYRGQNSFFGTPALQLVVTAERNDGTNPSTQSTINNMTMGGSEVRSATILSTGPRQNGAADTNGDNFFNIRGDSSPAADQAYGIARFDLTRVRAAFNTTYGAGNWRVRSVDMRLTQSNITATTGGNLLFHYTPDDVTDIKTLASPYRYPTPAPPSQSLITTFAFVRRDDTIDTVNLFGPAQMSGGAVNVANDIRTDNTLTLVVNPDNANTPGVVATYRGQEPVVTTTPRLAPKLTITANAAACLQGTLTWDNVGGPKPVTFTFEPSGGGNPLVCTVMGAPEQSGGGYVVGGLIPGIYDITVESDTYLRRVLTNVTIAGTTTQNITLLGGDGSGDNTVELTDLSLLIQAFDASVGDANYLANADYDCNGIVDVDDLAILIRNFDQSGD